MWKNSGLNVSRNSMGYGLSAAAGTADNRPIRIYRLMGDRDMTDEEVLNPLADSKLSEKPTAEKYTLGQRAADAIAKFAGSLAFIFSFTGALILWTVVNTILAADAFDSFPFILCAVPRRFRHRLS